MALMRNSRYSFPHARDSLVAGAMPCAQDGTVRIRRSSWTTGSLLNRSGEILRKTADDGIGALKGDAAQGIEHIPAVLLWDAGENVGDHMGKDVRHMRRSEFDDLNWTGVSGSS